MDACCEPVRIDRLANDVSNYTSPSRRMCKHQLVLFDISCVITSSHDGNPLALTTSLITQHGSHVPQALSLQDVEALLWEYRRCRCSRTCAGSGAAATDVLSQDGSRSFCHLQARLEQSEAILTNRHI